MYKKLSIFIKDFPVEFNELLSEVMLEAYLCYIVDDFSIHLEASDNLVSSGSEKVQKRSI